jgi:hypothetical protein
MIMVEVSDLGNGGLDFVFAGANRLPVGPLLEVSLPCVIVIMILLDDG